MTLLTQAIADILHWAQVEAPLPLAVVGTAFSLILGMAVFMAIVTAAKARQDRKRKVPEYTEEMPYMPRRALRADVVERLRKAGIKVEDHV